MIEDYDNVDYEYFKEWDIEQYKREIERLNNIINKKEQFLGDNIKRLEREVVKRDNIINGIEQYIKYYVMNNYKFDYNTADIILYQLEKLRNGDKE